MYISSIENSIEGNLSPLEKLKSHGVETLSNLELVSLVLDNSVHGSERTRVIRELIATIKRSHGEMNYIQDLLSIEGLEVEKAATVIACMQLARRYFFPERRAVETPVEAYKLLLQNYSNRQEENFVCIMLNAAQEVLRIREISRGSVNRAIIQPREVFVYAINDRATAIIVAHNHPSGNVLPSEEDFAVTKRLLQVGKIIGIPLLDHIIFADENYFSFTENGKMEPLS